jgi:uncharacterized protein
MSKTAATQPKAYRIRVTDTLGDISAEAWDACANPAQPPESNSEAAESTSEDETYNPFLSHSFLSALEESGSTHATTGWGGAHILVESEQDKLLACTPCYLKAHSQGEYVFDHNWADAYERAGGNYYPKLQSCVPFTPVTGRRLLTGLEPPGGALSDLLIRGLRAVREQVGASSIHATFVTKAEWDTFENAGFLKRTDRQYHWQNANYGTYDDFLAALASRKRKTLKRERRDALANGISIEHLTGKDLTERHWDDFYAFYMDTGARKWGRPYLNRSFFSLIGERMADRILLVMAKREGKYIAGALNLIGKKALYGRNWGCIEDHPFLHFEVCYHQAIDFAIAHGLKRVEAGAQGEHKIARGYLPVPTYSAHDIAEPGFRSAIANYLERERKAVDMMAEELTEGSPFKEHQD